MGNQAVRLPDSAIAGSANGNGTANGNGNASARKFGVFDLDLRAGELRRNGVKIKLQEQPFLLLAQLLERPGEVITREDLQRRLWPADTFVDFDHSLNAAIRRLRDALGDSAENPTFVETVARRGYRFLAPVTVVPPNGHGPLAVPPLATQSATPRFRRWWIAAVTGIVLVLLGLVLGFHLARRQATQPLRVTRLTANPVDDPTRTAAISRDGRYLAFSDDTGFYLRQIDTGETHSIAMPGDQLATSIAWLPDSAHMVVSLAESSHESSLWEISALGGKVRKLIDEGSRAVVSPDGQMIAFIAGKPIHQRIFLAPVTGDQPRELAGQDGDVFGDLAWSPDGKRLAYTTAKLTYGYGAKGMVAVVDVSNPSIVRSVSPTVVLSVYGLEAPLAWASDGRILYSLSEPRPRQADSNLWSIRLNERLQPEHAPIRLTNDQGAVVGVSVSADSQRIVYIKGVPQPDVYVGRLDSSGVLSEPERLTLDDHQDLPFDWTADGKNIIFMSDRTGTFDIYKQSIDQTVPELLVSGMEHSTDPRLSPDGSRLLYLVTPGWADTNTDVALMSVPLDGGASHQIAKSKWINNDQCSRAPASVCIYSTITDTGLTFYTFDPITGTGVQVLQLKNDLPQMYNWTLSPDGTTLAIAKGKLEAMSEPTIRLVSLKGAPDRWLTVAGWAGISSIDWAADSKSIWAATSGEKENALLQIDLNGKVRPVWHPRKIRVGWAIPSRDGKLLALHVDSRSANVWMLEK